MYLVDEPVEASEISVLNEISYGLFLYRPNKKIRLHLCSFSVKNTL
jgi:hypothetical protein